MKTPRFGCLTLPGLAAALVTLLLIAGAGAARGGAMFSPGGLNAEPGPRLLGGVSSHAATAGRCSACHTAFWEHDTMAGRCLACHTDLYRNEKSFHSLMLEQSRQMSCQDCHTDHHGPGGLLTIHDLLRFPHDQVGFSLQAHQKLAGGAPFRCSDCHGDQIGAVDQAVCERCHQQLDAGFSQAHAADFGAAALGDRCLACHDGLDTYGENFDHNRQQFPLQGAHTAAACAACHSGAASLADLRSAPQDCAACHTEDDAHDGQFGQDCAACHTSESWEGAVFDHSRTAFPLAGQHAQAACLDCHESGAYEGTPTACAACHAQDDAHDGQFGQDCAACHTSEGWSPAQFNGPHTFPLDHGGAGGQCSLCHTESYTSYTCYGCHEHSPAEIEEKHREEVGGDFQDCVRCHANGEKEEGEGGGRGEDGGGEHDEGDED
jgi:hypothetical protein